MLFQEFVFGNVSELSLECISLESLILIELNLDISVWSWWIHGELKQNV